MPIDEAQREALRADGWHAIEAAAFSSAAGELWALDDTGGLKAGLLTDERAANNRPAIVHGGALMTFADNALGLAACRAMESTNCSTVQLQFHFVAAAKVGDFITCAPEIVRKTSQLVFIRGLFEAGGRTVGSADAIFKFFDGVSKG
jgi:acyl-coenzyme A thioesterase PaaI-like protein